MSQTIVSTFRNFALLGAIGLMLSGCVVHTRGRANYRANATFRYQPAHVVVDSQPPPVRQATVRPAQPSSSAVWVEGHWSWQDGWVWVDGCWTVPERPNYVWVKPVAEVRVDGSYVYHRGYWRPPSARPAPVYVDTVATHDVDTTVTTRPPTRRVQVNVTPVSPPRASVSGSVKVSGSVSTNGSGNTTTRPVTTRPPTTVNTKPPTTTTTPPSGSGNVNTDHINRPVIVNKPNGSGSTSGSGNVNTDHLNRPVIVNKPNGSGSTSGSGNVNTGHINRPVIVGNKPTTSTPVHNNSSHSGTGTATAPDGIKCSIKTTAVTTGGYLTLQGQGLASIQSVKVNGKSVALFSKRDTMISIKIPPGTKSGLVSLTTNKKKTFSCGRVTIK